MNQFTISISSLSVIINTVIRVITALIFIAFLIPLFLKEARVRNGLKLLRYELLFTGSIIFFINSVGLIIILLRFFSIDSQAFTNIVTYINTFGFLAYALVKLKIYTQKYSGKNKELHAKFEKMEAKELEENAEKENKLKHQPKIKKVL